MFASLWKRILIIFVEFQSYFKGKGCLFSRGLYLCACIISGCSDIFANMVTWPPSRHARYHGDAVSRLKFRFKVGLLCARSLCACARCVQYVCMDVCVCKCVEYARFRRMLLSVIFVLFNWRLSLCVQCTVLAMNMRACVSVCVWTCVLFVCCCHLSYLCTFMLILVVLWPHTFFPCHYWNNSVIVLLDLTWWIQ